MEETLLQSEITYTERYYPQGDELCPGFDESEVTLMEESDTDNFSSEDEENPFTAGNATQFSFYLINP